MSELKICRICLRTECKVYNFDRFQLKSYYEEVMALKVNEKDGLPHYFCFECATMLHKFHKFKEKCYIGQKTLKEISWRGPITYEAVYKVDRTLKNLKSPFEILTVTKRVRTYCTKDTFDITESESEREEREVPEVRDTRVRDIEVQYVSEDSMTDKDADLDPDYDPVDENIKDDELEVEGCKLLDVAKEDEIVEQQIEENKPKSPTTVFVDVKKEVVMLKSEKIKERRKSFSEYGLKKSNPSFAKPKTKFLDLTYWKKSSLSEEEAIKSFRERSENPKYVAAAYKCADCFKGFSKEDMLKRHKQLRHSETLGALECRFCHMRFKWDCHLRKHMRQHFTRYECQRCDLVCTLENTAMMHDDYHKGVVKKCVQCGEEFKHLSSYYSHLRTHRSEYICTLCGVSFVSPLGLHIHKKIKHINNEIIESPDDDEEVNTFCSKCNIRFETRKAYEEHLFHSAMHMEGVEDEVTDEGTVPRKILGQKLKAKITQDLKIKKPDEIYRDGTLLNRKRKRKQRRVRRKPTTCHQCGKEFETQAACMKHHTAEHPRTSFFTERHICEICGASLALGSVAMHQNMHTREKLFSCETCGRTFHTKIGVKRHQVTHTGEKPFACSLCEKRFTQSNSMKLHFNTFHLKQPYPKRNRRKKKVDIPPEPIESSSDESDGSIPEPQPRVETRLEPPPVVAPDRLVTHENIHYLTLS